MHKTTYRIESMGLIHIIGLPKSGHLHVGLKVAQALHIPLYPSPYHYHLFSYSDVDQCKLMTLDIFNQLRLAQTLCQITKNCVVDVNPVLLEVSILRAFRDKVINLDQYGEFLQYCKTVESELDSSHTFALVVSPDKLHAKTQQETQYAELSLVEIEQMQEDYVPLCVTKGHTMIAYNADNPNETIELILSFLT